jgi:3-hydroxyacyl-[acyl-carrier-protein] dehydratase
MYQKPILDAKQIAKILPHRYPFLLIDKVVELNAEDNLIVAQKNLTINEEFFQGHFPDVPLMPGVLIIEALAQAGGILIHEKGYVDKIAVLLTVTHVKFRKPVKPGDVLFLKAKGLHFSSKAGKVHGAAYLNGGDTLAVEAEIGFALVDRDRI